MHSLVVNAATDERFWQLPEQVEAAMRAALPAHFALEVCREPSQLGGLIKSASAVVGWPFATALARRAPQLCWVHLWTAGVPETWRELSGDALRLTSAAGINAASVAQHALCLVLAGLRGVRARSLSMGTFASENLAVARAPEALSAAVIGHGHVGKRLAALLAPLFGTVSAVTRTPSACSGVPYPVHGFDALHEVVEQSDVVVLALPLTRDTRALFHAPAFYGSLRPDACLVNVARGELVDEQALLAHLARNPDATYYTDVTHPEPYPAEGALWSCPQVVITPHVAGRRADLWAAHQAQTVRLMQEILPRLGANP